MRFISELSIQDKIIISSAALFLSFALLRIIVPDAEKVDLEKEQVKAQLARSLKAGGSFRPNDDERRDMLPMATANFQELREAATRQRASQPEVILDRIQFDAMFDASSKLHAEQMDALEEEALAAPDNQDDLNAGLNVEEIRELRETGKMVW